MKRHDDKILGLLLDKYEGSLLYTGQNHVNISIAVKITKAVLPEYFDQTGTEYAVIDEQLKALEQTGLIHIIWGKTNKHIIERCELNVSEADRAYERLKRVPKRDKEAKLLAYIGELRARYSGSGRMSLNHTAGIMISSETELVADKDVRRCTGLTANQCRVADKYSVTLAYLDSIEERLLSGKSVKSDVDTDNLSELGNICMLINAIETNGDECFLREFSLKVFHDTKTAERYLPKAVGIIRRFAAGQLGMATKTHAEGGIVPDDDAVKTVQGLGAEGAGRQVDVGDICQVASEIKTMISAGMSDEEILEEYNIYKNPSWVMIKGSGRFKLGESVLELRSLPFGFGFAGADIDRLSFEAGMNTATAQAEAASDTALGTKDSKTARNIGGVKQAAAGIQEDKPLSRVPRRILTIENLTSFHRWQDKQGDTLAVYLGGYANKYRRKLIGRLHDAYPDAEYVHFGDIDCGGFYIWKALCEETDIQFKTVKMDAETYLANYRDGRPLTDNDRRTLMRMKEESFFAAQHELFDLMLDKGMKTEQEGIEL